MTTTSNNEKPFDNPSEQDTPAIYAACLAACNNGDLHGDWIYADQDPEDIQRDINKMLRRSPVPRSEEWAIHDYQGFTPWRPHEHETLQALSRVALGIVEHGPAYAHWVSCQGTAEEEVTERFEDAYLGKWDSIADYAENLVADIGDDPDGFTPSWLAPYVSIDYAALGRDMAHDMYASEDGHGIHLFRAD